MDEKKNILSLLVIPNPNCDTLLDLDMFFNTINIQYICSRIFTISNELLIKYNENNNDKLSNNSEILAIIYKGEEQLENNKNITISDPHIIEYNKDIISKYIIENNNFRIINGESINPRELTNFFFQFKNDKILDILYLYMHVFQVMETDNLSFPTWIYNHGGDKFINNLTYNNDSLLHLCSLSGELNGIRFLLENGCNKFAGNSNGNNTPLHLSCSRGYLEIAQELYTHGDVLTKRNISQDLPIHLATHYGFISLTKWIISVDETQLFTKNRTGDDALHLAAYRGHTTLTYWLIEQVLKKNKSLDEKNNNGDTPLFLAAYHGHIDIVLELEKRGCEIDNVNNNGDAPLHLASYNGHLDLVKILLQKITRKECISEKNNSGDTLLSLASYNGHTKLVKWLYNHNLPIINFVNNSGDSTLHLAAYKGHEDLVRWFIELGCNINLPNKIGDTPLILACRCDRYNAVDILLEAGCNLEVKNNAGDTALIAAAQSGKIRIIDLLLQYGDTLDQSNGRGQNIMEILDNKGLTKELRELLLKRRKKRVFQE